MVVTPETAFGPAATTVAKTEHRRFSRSRFQGDVRVFWAGPALAGVGRDLSDRGMSFSVPREAVAAGTLALGNRIRLSFKTPEAAADTYVNVVGEVARVSTEDQPDRTVVAVTFTHF
jgi:hypothetical protein